jgi:hypothetical protein
MEKKYRKTIENNYNITTEYQKRIKYLIAQYFPVSPWACALHAHLAMPTCKMPQTAKAKPR